MSQAINIKKYVAFLGYELIGTTILTMAFNLNAIGNLGQVA